MTASLPLFPLHTVLFPGGRLALKIFEARYVDLVSHCLREASPFGVCLIRQGGEVGPAASIFPVGTSAKIVQWHQRADGLLGIEVEGERRFRVLGHDTAANGLVSGAVEWLEDASPPAAADAEAICRLVGEIAGADSRLAVDNAEMPDAAWMSYRVAELLPDTGMKQRLLESGSVRERIEYLNKLFSARGHAA